MPSERRHHRPDKGKVVDQRRDSGPSSPRPHRSGNPNFYSRAPEQRRNMSMEELLGGIEGRLKAIELWVGNLIDNGVVFVAGPHDREPHNTAQLNVDGKYAKVDFTLRLNAIPRVARPPREHRSSGVDLFRRQSQRKVREEVVVDIEDSKGRVTETRVYREYVPDDAERSRQWE